MTDEIKFQLLKDVVKFVGTVNHNYTDTRKMIVDTYREWIGVMNEDMSAPAKDE